jgi:hypothetical protein
MIARISEQGLLIPKELLGEAKEAEIHAQRGRIVIVLDPADDPIRRLGKNPVIAPESDVSVNLDKYIYGI